MTLEGCLKEGEHEQENLERKENDGWANPSRCYEVTVFCDCKCLGIFLTSSESGSHPFYSIRDGNRTQLSGPRPLWIWKSHQWCHIVLSSFSRVSLKVTSRFLIISKLLIYQGIHYMWGGNVAYNSFCFPNFILDLGNILSFPRDYLVFLFRARILPSYSSKEMSLLICPCIFSSKRMNTSKTNKLSVAEYTKTSIHRLLPAFSPFSQHTHLEQVTRSQHLQFLSVVIFVRAKCRATWTQSLFLSFAKV